MQFIRGDAKSSFFEDREQIPKVAKLRPIVHCPPPTHHATKEALPIELKTGPATPPLLQILPRAIGSCNRKLRFGQTYSKRPLHASDAASRHGVSVHGARAP
jgi:hypothetical protein